MLGLIVREAGPWRRASAHLGHSIRLGAIKGAIWQNATEAGPRYNATISRLFKNGDTWESTDSFGRDDLLVLGKVADPVHSWIFQHQGQPPTQHDGVRQNPKALSHA